MTHQNLSTVSLNKKLKNFLLSIVMVVSWILLFNSQLVLVYFYLLIPIAWVTLIGGALAVTSRILREQIEKSNFFYTFAGCFNTFLGVSLLLKSLGSEDQLFHGFFIYLIALFVGGFILVDILFLKALKY